MANEYSHLKQKHHSINLLKDSGGAISKKKRLVVIYRVCAGILGLVILVSSGVYGWTFYEMQRKAQLEDQIEARKADLRELLPVLSKVLTYKHRMDALAGLHFDEPSIPRQSLLHLRDLGQTLTVRVNDFKSTDQQLIARIESDTLADFHTYQERLQKLQEEKIWNSISFSSVAQRDQSVSGDLTVVINPPKAKVAPSSKTNNTKK